MANVLGQAIHDYYHRLSPGKLWIHNEFGKPDEMPIDVYFRDEEDMPEMELIALQYCKGSTLDVGAGAGSHALLLQEKNVPVTALEISPLAVALIKKRGVKHIVLQNIFDYTGERFDTILMLMNGIGLCATISGLHRLLQHAKTLLQPNGQLLFDSSDVGYLYRKKPRPLDRYYGEINFKYEYKKQKTPWFSWLYVDQQTLTGIALQEGFKTEVLFEDDHDQYLVRLTLLQQ